MNLKDTLEENNVPVKILLAVGIASAAVLLYGIWTTVRAGSISIFVPERGSAIFLDGKRADMASSDGQTIDLKQIPAGEHSILVYSEGYYPWEKTLIVSTSETTNASAFSILQEITPSYKKTKFTEDELNAVFSLFETGDTDKKISFSGDGSVEIKKEGNNITAVWLGNESSLPYFFCNNTVCENSVLVFASNAGQIGTINFYPQREDVVLFSLDNGIYALEIDKRGTQNFQPIYIGETPIFAVDEKDLVLYIKDGDLLFGVEL